MGAKAINIDFSDEPIDWSGLEERIENARLEDIDIPRRVFLHIFFNAERRHLLAQCPWVSEVIMHNSGDIPANAIMSSPKLAYISPRLRKLIPLAFAGQIPFSLFSAIPSTEFKLALQLFLPEELKPCIGSQKGYSFKHPTQRIRESMDSFFAAIESGFTQAELSDELERFIAAIPGNCIQPGTIPDISRFLGLQCAYVTYTHLANSSHTLLHPGRIHLKPLLKFLVRYLSSQDILDELLRAMETLDPCSLTFDPALIIALGTSESPSLTGFQKFCAWFNESEPSVCWP